MRFHDSSSRSDLLSDVHPPLSYPLPLRWAHLVVPIIAVAFQLQTHPSLLGFVIPERGSADIIPSLLATRGWALPIEEDCKAKDKEGAFSSGAVSTPRLRWIGMLASRQPSPRRQGSPAGVALQHATAAARLSLQRGPPPSFQIPSPLHVSFLQRPGSHSLQSLPLCTLELPFPPF